MIFALFPHPSPARAYGSLDVLKKLPHRRSQLPVNISPSSDGVGKKGGYLGVATVSVLSRKLVFETIGKVFRVEIPGGKKNPNMETFGTDSLERLLSE